MLESSGEPVPVVLTFGISVVAVVLESLGKPVPVILMSGINVVAVVL